MIIISHRGYWHNQEEKNTETAFIRSFDMGFGTETDIRDCNGKLVISHDIPNGTEISLDYFLSLLKGRDLPLALNIKADGLSDLLVSSLSKANVTNAFVFDMSIPDQMSYVRENKINVFARVSEYEKTPAFYHESFGIWLDGFHSIWYDKSLVEGYISEGKYICIVSPELHKRSDYKDLWKMLKISGLSVSTQLMLCTDLPEDARDFFKEDI
ncbi:phosphodiesterase [Rahnella sp. PD12R]|uniref:phosphodiesterase n=1 Tax=Rahnella sp. PD12R TaxID=2855688 RepID=UPI001C4782E2|nr:phosphodiesterase [Rahnella sp. PD12R]MBV6819537.1 phosphodiesterase [Rahnella sp. PD12R]